MKRIIAAALSILVGAFGYTIVDQSIDDRVSKLESEVVELRGEISSYHAYQPTDAGATSTTQQDEGTHPTVFDVGTKLTKTSSSLHKFCVREYSNGRFVFISPNSYDMSLYETTDPDTIFPYGITTAYPDNLIVTTTKRETTTTNKTTTTPDDPCDPIKTTTTRPNNAGYPIATTTRPETTTQYKTTTRYITTTRCETTTRSETTTKSIPIREFFVYLTDSTAVVSSVDTSTSLKYSYDNDYSQISEAIRSEKTYVTITYRGYTDPSLAGKTISFRPSFIGGSYHLKQTIADNVIKKDGTFEFSATYLLDHLYSTQYSINSVEIR